MFYSDRARSSNAVQRHHCPVCGGATVHKITNPAACYNTDLPIPGSGDRIWARRRIRRCERCYRAVEFWEITNEGLERWKNWASNLLAENKKLREVLGTVQEAVQSVCI